MVRIAIERRLELNNMVSREGILTSAVDCHESRLRISLLRKAVFVCAAITIAGLLGMIQLLTFPPQDELWRSLLGNIWTGIWTSGLLALLLFGLEVGVQGRAYIERVKHFAILFGEDYQTWYDKYYSLIEGLAGLWKWLGECGITFEDKPDTLETIVLKNGQAVRSVKYAKTDT